MYLSFMVIVETWLRMTFLEKGEKSLRSPEGCAEVELLRKKGHRKRDYKGVPITQDTLICYFSL